MVALVMLLWNFWKRLKGNYLTVIYRLPAAKSLQIHLMGLAAGVTGLFIASAAAYESTFAALWATVFWIGLILLGVLFASGLTTLLAVITFLALSFVGASSSSVLFILIQGYVMGYALGAVFATLYNDLVYIYLRVFERNLVKIAFGVYDNHEVNIIKSPYQLEEMATMEALKRLRFYTESIRRDPSEPNLGNNIRNIRRQIRKAHRRMAAESHIELLRLLAAANLRDGLNNLSNQLTNAATRDNALRQVENQIEPLQRPRENQLYHFEIAQPPVRPYTIVFVANPFIRKRMPSGGNQPDDFAPDPIMNDRELFLHSVNRALRSFEGNEVVGHREIWSRIRVVIIFDESLKTEAARDWALIEELQIPLIINDESIENIIDPMREMTGCVRMILQRYRDRHHDLPEVINNLDFNDIDIIFGMSAWPNYIRSYAHFSDYREGVGQIRNLSQNGREFHLNNNAMVHENRVSEPGRVALSVVGANQRTFIHEFAHAMSSMINGAIADEYTDRILVAIGHGAPPNSLYINQNERILRGRPQFDGIPKRFADYNGAIFHSDLAHPSAEEHWLSYFPDRPDPDVGCTMDRYRGYYRFDNLIHNFMYDRLVAKLNRP